MRGMIVRKNIVFPLIFFVLALVITNCQGLVGEPSKPIVIIVSPPSGSVYTVGDEVIVQSTSTDPIGITRVELFVDGDLVRQDPSPIQQGQAQFSLIQSWIAQGAGPHTITVRAFNSQGNWAESGIIINVNEQTALQPTAIIPIATAVPLATPLPTTVSETAVPPTTAPVPPPTTATSAPPCVNNSQFVADVTVPDGTIFTPGAVFTKIWRVRNNGTCSWENYSLVFVSGTQMAGSALFPVPDTPPGQTADLTVPMTAPTNYGAYTGLWRMRDANGKVFGTNLTVVINVPAPPTVTPPTPTATPTATNPPAACSGRPNDFTFSASSTSITPGQSVTLSWSAVTNATGVFLDGGEFSNEGVATPGERIVTPGATTTYTLRAICAASGQTREKHVTINVGASVGNFAGEWVMNFGTMNLTQSGNTVTGTYYNAFGSAAGTVAGNVSGNTLTGTWTLGGGSGTFQFTLSGDGKRFDGNWNGTEKWCGARPGENFPNGCSFAGNWNAKLSGFPNCPMTLRRRDNTITGTYCNGTVQGTITYMSGAITVASGSWDTGGSTGPFTWYLMGYNGRQFNGNYNTSFEWCGWRSGASEPSPCLR